MRGVAALRSAVVVVLFWCVIWSISFPQLHAFRTILGGNSLLKSSISRQYSRCAIRELNTRPVLPSFVSIGRDSVRNSLASTRLSLVKRYPWSGFGDLSSEIYSYYAPPAYLRQILHSRPDKILSASDIVLGTGRDFHSVRKDVLKLAQAVGANLLVTNKGEILYQFPSHFDRILLQRSLIRRLQQFYSIVSVPIYAIIRTLFGIILVSSVALVVASLIAASVAIASGDGRSTSDRFRYDSSSKNARDNEKEEKEKKRGYGHMMSTRQPHIYLRPYIHVDIMDVVYQIKSMLFGLKRESYKGSHSNLHVEKNDSSTSKLGLFESLFSYVFGDGNPNTGKRA